MSYYVIMTDKFLSGWGEAKGKINKFIVKCDTKEQALLIYKNAKRRTDMKLIRITTTKPRYNKKGI